MFDQLKGLGSILKQAQQMPGRLKGINEKLATMKATGSAGGGMVEVEINGVGDNPIFFPDDEDVLTGANFQGTPMSYPLDFIGAGVTMVGVMSERRLNRMLNKALSAGLPAYLTKSAGMFSGLMLMQYTAGSLLCESRILSTPACIGSIPAAADQEDFVSMGMTTTLKTRDILKNCMAVIGMELIAGAQALDFIEGRQPGKGSKAAYDVVRKYVDFLEEDRPIHGDINKMAEVVASGEIVTAVEAAVGELD